MGLSFSHCQASWYYTDFDNFRCKLAAEIGINLANMYGYEGTRSWNTINDDIVPLLNHSGCDGELTPEECRIVAPRLRQLVMKWDADDADKKKAYMLADGMESAANANQELWFC
jgi:hypothetical protein